MNLHIDPAKVATEKFSDPDLTAKGERRAKVPMSGLTTLWFNTGTLCNLACKNCYIESTPKNDRLVYLSHQEALLYLDEIKDQDLPTTEIGITGGEPFMNPDIIGILEACLSAGYQVLVLTNAMRPMMKHEASLAAISRRYGDQLTLRVSLDHFDAAVHESERGRRSWQPALQGLQWLSSTDSRVHVAARTRWGDTEEQLRAGFQQLFDDLDVPIDASNPETLVLFPEMDETADVAEITEACWGLLNVKPSDMMCATARMIVRRRGAQHPEVVACTLLPYDDAFSLGNSLAESLRPVSLNHPHCARFCVLGGGSCSA